MRKTSRGFTLVELLIAISIIGILSAGFITNAVINTSRNARDQRRKSDLEQIRSALELCRIEAGAYPANISTEPLVCSGVTIMDEIPDDPKTNAAYTYSRLTVSTYTLTATMEDRKNSNQPTGYSYIVKQP